MTPTNKSTKVDELLSKIEKLEKENKVLQHAKESDLKMVSIQLYLDINKKIIDLHEFRPKL